MATTDLALRRKRLGLGWTWRVGLALFLLVAVFATGTLEAQRDLEGSASSEAKPDAATGSAGGGDGERAARSLRQDEKLSPQGEAPEGVSPSSPPRKAEGGQDARDQEDEDADQDQDQEPGSGPLDEAPFPPRGVSLLRPAAESASASQQGAVGGSSVFGLADFRGGFEAPLGLVDAATLAAGGAEAFGGGLVAEAAASAAQELEALAIQAKKTLEAAEEAKRAGKCSFGPTAGPLKTMMEQKELLDSDFSR